MERYLSAYSVYYWEIYFNLLSKLTGMVSIFKLESPFMVLWNAPLIVCLCGGENASGGIKLIGIVEVIVLLLALNSALCDSEFYSLFYLIGKIGSRKIEFLFLLVKGYIITLFIDILLCGSLYYSDEGKQTAPFL
jgi:hypothetical protein